MTPDGNCTHVLLEGYDYQPSRGLQPDVLQQVKLERKRPLGSSKLCVFFALRGPTAKTLLAGLDALNRPH